MKVETEIIGENSWQDWLASVSITQEKPLAMVADATFTNQHDVQWIGIALCAQVKHAIYWPFGETIPKQLKELLEDATVPKVVGDFKQMCQLCQNQDISFQGIIGDLMIAAHLTDSLEKRFELDFLVQRRLHKNSLNSFQAILPHNFRCWLNQSGTRTYFGERAAATLQVWESLSKHLKQNHLQIYLNILSCHSPNVLPPWNSKASE